MRPTPEKYRIPLRVDPREADWYFHELAEVLQRRHTLVAALTTSVSDTVDWATSRILGGTAARVASTALVHLRVAEAMYGDAHTCAVKAGEAWKSTQAREALFSTRDAFSEVEKADRRLAVGLPGDLLIAIPWVHGIPATSWPRWLHDAGEAR